MSKFHIYSTLSTCITQLLIVNVLLCKAPYVDYHGYGISACERVKGAYGRNRGPHCKFQSITKIQNHFSLPLELGAACSVSFILWSLFL